MKGVVSKLKKIVLFDGECNFCNTSVQFIIKRDPNKEFQFASLQSDIGQSLLTQFEAPKNIDSLVLIDGDRCYLQSTAALRICKYLKGSYKLLYFFTIIPRPIRNAVYRFIAKNRYKLFGKTESCMIPSAEDRNRFIS